MLVVIDESGCTGFSQGSSSHFVIAMIIFDCFDDAEQTANIIHKLKRDLNMKREFKFSSSDNLRKDAFFEAIKSCRFAIRLFVVEKRLLYSPHLKNKDDAFVNYCLRNLMQSGMHRIRNATFKIDGKGSRKFKRECGSYLRRHVGIGVINKLKFCDSQGDVLIQLADMIVSAYSRPYNNPDKQNAYRWRNTFDSKIENVWNFR
jgi:hypothetical protein